MADINFHSMKKKDMETFLTGYCRHRHRYMEHPNCFLVEQGYELKEGYLDIEASNLKANFGIMLSYCIKTKGKKEIKERVITKEELMDGTLDKRLVEDCINDIMSYDKIYGYYSTRFDIPFIRSRALYWGIEFPPYDVVKHKDVYYMVRNKLCLHRNRLEDACRLMGIEGKTHLNGNYWIKALTGDKESLEYILDHNEQDVIILEKLHNRLKDFVKDTNTSI
jgi:uncharacterized protein YprB with RNaseH-like and TPR domain